MYTLQPGEVSLKMKELRDHIFLSNNFRTCLQGKSKGTKPRSVGTLNSSLGAIRWVGRGSMSAGNWGCTTSRLHICKACAKYAAERHGRGLLRVTVLSALFGRKSFFTTLNITNSVRFQKPTVPDLSRASKLYSHRACLIHNNSTTKYCNAPHLRCARDLYLWAFHRE